jgi:hypothetical protein
MTPSAYNNNMQLVQTPDQVVILNEMIYDARIIPLDGRPHLQIPQWIGSSRGRWEGNALVVETINRREEAQFQGAGRNLRVTERFTRADANTLIYDVTLDDPTMWTKPWRFMVPMAKSAENIYEYACHEGNYSVPNILRGLLAKGETSGSR